MTATCVGLRLVGGAFHRLWGGKVHVLRAKVAGLPLHNANLFGTVDGPPIRLSAVHTRPPYVADPGSQPYAEASRRNIRGRSLMNKAELKRKLGR